MLGSRSRDGSHGSLARAAGSKYQLKIAVAVVIGVFCGATYAFLHPKGFFSYAADFHSMIVTKQGDSVTKCHTAEYLSEVNKALFQCQSEFSEVRYDFRKKEVDYRCCEQIVWTTRHEVKLMNASKPLGPFATVCGSETPPKVPGVESIDPKLVEILKTVAQDREILVAVANSNVSELLEVWVTAVQTLWIPNYLVVALDNSTATFCRKNYVPVYEPEPPFNKTDVSSFRFRLLRDFLHLGYSVLFSDVDVVFLRNPFEQQYLHRDVDIEAMTDGHNDSNAYGFDDIEDDPDMGYGRYAHSIRILFYNSGFFFIRPSIPSIELLDRVHTRLLLNKKDGWDQLIFNQELFLPSSPGYGGLHVSKRTMDMYLFLNSKTLFMNVKKSYLKSDMRPVAVHVNYHLDKRVRMQAVLNHYERQNRTLLDSLPIGSVYPLKFQF